MQQYEYEWYRHSNSKIYKEKFFLSIYYEVKKSIETQNYDKFCETLKKLQNVLNELNIKARTKNPKNPKKYKVEYIFPNYITLYIDGKHSGRLPLNRENFSKINCPEFRLY